MATKDLALKGTSVSRDSDMLSQLDLNEPYVFVSNAKEDRDTAIRLCRTLRQWGLSPWLDLHELIPGQDWEATIRQDIERSTCVLLLLSEKSVSKRGYVQAELRHALKIAQEQPQQGIFLVPVRLEVCNVPAALSHL